MRKVSKSSLKADLPKIREVYNDAWEKNWGFVPMTPEEMDFMAARLKPLLDENFLFLGEARRLDGTLEPVAFMLCLPDYNTAIQPLGGRLLPLGWLKFLLGLKKIRTLRVVTLGLKKDYRMRGIQSIMFEEGLKACLKRGLTGCRSLLDARGQRPRAAVRPVMGREALQDLPHVRQDPGGLRSKV